MRRAPLATPGSTPSLLARLLREPLLHFLVLGLALFVLADWRARPASGPDAARRIELSADDLRQLSGLWRSQWNRDPSPEELRRLVDDQVREEVAFREALAAGLDRQDILVRRRLVERMNSLWASAGEAGEPTEAALRDWYAARAGQFAPPREATFATLYFSDRLRGGKAKEEAILARDALAGKSDGQADVQGLGDVTELPPRAAAMSPDEAAGVYGPELAEALGRLPMGSWQGPVAVAGGYALVFVEARIPGEPLPFEAVREQALEAWRRERREESRQRAYAAARARYAVALPDTAPGAP